MNNDEYLQYIVLTSALQLGYNDQQTSAFLHALAHDIDTRLAVKEAERILQSVTTTTPKGTKA